MEDNEAAISWAEFSRVEIRAGTIIGARLNPKAKKPAYILDIDFGVTLGNKSSSAQLTEAYEAEDLINKQIIAVMNFPPKRVAGIVSEVLVLAVVQDDGPTVLVSPTQPVSNGARLA